jgi:hypothetical protein
MSATDLEINREISVTVRKNGPIVTLVFKVAGQSNIGPISLSAAEAIRAGGDIRKNGESELIPGLFFAPQDAAAFGPWLMRFTSDS